MWRKASVCTHAIDNEGRALFAAQVAPDGVSGRYPHQLDPDPHDGHSGRLERQRRRLAMGPLFIGRQMVAQLRVVTGLHLR